MRNRTRKSDALTSSFRSFLTVLVLLLLAAPVLAESSTKILLDTGDAFEVANTGVEASLDGVIGSPGIPDEQKLRVVIAILTRAYERGMLVKTSLVAGDKLLVIDSALNVPVFTTASGDYRIITDPALGYIGFSIPPGTK